MTNRNRIHFPEITAILFFILSIFLTGCAFAPAAAPTPTPSQISSPSSPTAEQGAYWPTDGWRTSTPEAQGMDGDMLERMIGGIELQKLNLHSILVVHNGYIVHETYFGSQAADQRHIQYSVTKSFVSTLIGIAVDRGWIDRIDRRVMEFFPGRTAANPDPRKESMTVEDLLTMRSGLDWHDSDQDFSNIFRSTDWVQFMLDLPMVASPGTGFTYCSGCTNLLSAVLQEATGETARNFGGEALFQPLGISDLDWEDDPKGISIGGWGLFITPRDMAKLGYLYLRGGEWDGRRILSADWVREATREHTTTDGALGYGYQWWTYPSWDAYAALGRDGQTIFVIPGEELIVVTTAGGVGHDKIFQLIEDYVYPAILA
ncbi:MAG: serine hydrolase [Anaerolineales bacterium]|nr:serine hydrolase [Anaerolineales bacterium]